MATGRSAIVVVIALVLIIYYVTTMIRRKPLDMACLDKLSEFLLYALIVDFSLELLDFSLRRGGGLRRAQDAVGHVESDRRIDQPGQVPLLAAETELAVAREPDGTGQRRLRPAVMPDP